MIKNSPNIKSARKLHISKAMEKKIKDAMEECKSTIKNIRKNRELDPKRLHQPYDL